MKNKSLIQKYNLQTPITYLFFLSAAILIIFYFTNRPLEDNYISPEAAKLGNTGADDSLIVSRVLLIGDAGAPSSNKKEPVLSALQKQLSKLNNRSFVVFLGDNIYPYGMPDVKAVDRQDAEKRITEQLNVLIESNSKGVFLPGNHDWAQGSENGWLNAKNLQKFINSKYSPQIKYLPENGCPGPSVIEVGGKVKIIVLDSQWWLQPGNKPKSNCKYNSEKKVVDALDSILYAFHDDLVIITAHHPLASYGPHGGYFSWKDHIFPLLNIYPSLWIPLPIIGSAYPLSRMIGISPQDISNSTYQNYINEIEGVLSKHNNIIYASGHEHSLQVLKGINNSVYLISGFGTSTHSVEIIKGENMWFGASKPGFMQVDLYNDENVQITIFEVDKYSNPIKVFSFCPFMKNENS